MINVNWTTFKDFVTTRNVSVQYIDANGNYYLRALDGYFSIDCILNKSQNLEEVADFETNFKDNGNQSPNAIVTTQYEKNDKDLKLAKSTITLNNSNVGTDYLKIPGTFGSADGRYVAGGYAITEDYHKNDYMTVFVEDTDRLIAMALALAADPNATAPLSDQQVKDLGILPAPFNKAFPDYPIVKSYTDDELDAANHGWFFWATALGNNLNPIGECEIEPIGGYGFIPAGMYLKLTYTRDANLTSGGCRTNIYWGKKE